MGKFIVYAAIMATMILLFHLGGLVGETPNSTLLKILLSPENIGDESTGSFLSKVLLVAGGLALGGAVIVGFVFGQAEIVIMGTTTVFLVGLLLDVISVYNEIFAASPVIAILFFGVFLLTFILTAVDYWRGRD